MKNSAMRQRKQSYGYGVGSPYCVSVSTMQAQCRHNAGTVMGLGDTTGVLILFSFCFFSLTWLIVSMGCFMFDVGGSIRFSLFSI